MSHSTVLTFVFFRKMLRRSLRVCWTSNVGNLPTPPDADFMASMMKEMGMEEREWTCWCGHKFRAPGVWVPVAPISCMAPKCPNPNYFINGQGGEMLKQGKGGSPLPSTPLGGGCGGAIQLDSGALSDPPSIASLLSGGGGRGAGGGAIQLGDGK